MTDQSKADQIREALENCLGCVAGAEAEGLHETINSLRDAENFDDADVFRLIDLIERRLLWVRNYAEPALALPQPATATSDFEQVFIDACDEIGCAYDNEALLQAIAGLKSKPATVLERTLQAVQGRIMNANIDLQTGHTKAAGIKTLDGIIKFIDAAIATKNPHDFVQPTIVSQWHPPHTETKGEDK